MSGAPTSELFTDGPITTDPGSLLDYESSPSEQFQSGLDSVIFNPTARLFRGIIGGAQDIGHTVTSFAPWGGLAPNQDDNWVSPGTAREEVKRRNLDLTIPDQGISRFELDAMQTLKQREIAQGVIGTRPHSALGAVAGLAGGFAAGATDPLYLASSLIPLIPEARVVGWLGAAGENLAARAAVRAGVGGLSGAVGAAAVEPINYFGAQAEQTDYDLRHSFLNIMFGGALGGGLHVLGGGVFDWRMGRALGPLQEGLREVFARMPDRVQLAATHQAVTALEAELPVQAQQVFESAIRPEQMAQARGAARSIELSEDQATWSPEQREWAGRKTNMRIFSIMREGRNEGHIIGQIQGDDYRVFDMSVPGGEGALGPSAVRRIGAELRRQLPPEVKTVSGERFGGARSEAFAEAMNRATRRAASTGRPTEAVTAPEVRINLDQFGPRAGTASEIGAPPGIRVYHGTNAEFDRFDIGRAGQGAWRNAGLAADLVSGGERAAIYTTTEASHAAKFGPNVKALDARLTNPLTFDGKAYLEKWLDLHPEIKTAQDLVDKIHEGDVYRAVDADNLFNRLIGQAKAEGHDGVVVDFGDLRGAGERGGKLGKVVIVLDPDQLSPAAPEIGGAPPDAADIQGQRSVADRWAAENQRISETATREVNETKDATAEDLAADAAMYDAHLQSMRERGLLTPEDEAAILGAETIARDLDERALAYEAAAACEAEG